MHYFASLIYAWTAVGIGWILFDLITAPKAWLNFTSWVWTLQTLFFLIYSIILKDNEYGPWHRFLDTDFLPILFACEWATAVAVVYMMVARASMLENAIESYGIVLANLGSFIVHYLTLVMLIIYISYPRQKKAQYLNCNILPGPLYYLAHLQFLIICVFVFFYMYILVQEPATHYGISNTSNFEAEVGMIVTGIIGVLVFHNLPADSAW